LSAQFTAISHSFATNIKKIEHTKEEKRLGTQVIVIIAAVRQNRYIKLH